jgi:chemotaxis signal transduction protein
MPSAVLRCHMGGKLFLVPAHLVAEVDKGLITPGIELTSGKRVALDRRPSSEDPDPDTIYEFPKRLAMLAAGVESIVAEDECVPLVSAAFFEDLHPVETPLEVRRIQREETSNDPPPAGERRFIVFGVPGASGLQFALSMSQVLEVSRGQHVAALTGQASHVIGVTMWRGEIIPVVDLAVAGRLGPGLHTEWPRMMIVRNSRNQVFAIPANGQIWQPPASSHVYAPETASVRPMNAIRAVFRFEGSPLLVPDLDALWQ